MYYSITHKQMQPNQYNYLYMILLNLQSLINNDSFK